MIVKCSLCDQLFDETDLLINKRKKRHEDHHNLTKIHGSYNQTWGKVEWLKVSPIPSSKALNNRSRASGW